MNCVESAPAVLVSEVRCRATESDQQHRFIPLPTARDRLGFAPGCV